MYKEEIFEKETVADLLKKMPETPPKMWSVEDFLILLDHMGLGIYKSIFSKNYKELCKNFIFL